MRNILDFEKKKIPLKKIIDMQLKKTGKLFSFCCMAPVIISKKFKYLNKFDKIGSDIGLLFQITDDLIGIMGDSKLTKKPVGNDIREGKKSLPILLAIRKARGKDKQKILKVFGRSNATKKDIQSTVNIIRSLGIEDIVRKKALQYANRATKSLDSYSGTHKKEMVSLLDFVVKRSL